MAIIKALALASIIAAAGLALSAKRAPEPVPAQRQLAVCALGTSC